MLRSYSLYAADVRDGILELLDSGVESGCGFDLREPLACTVLVPKHFLLSLQPHVAY